MFTGESESITDLEDAEMTGPLPDRRPIDVPIAHSPGGPDTSIETGKV